MLKMFFTPIWREAFYVPIAHTSLISLAATAGGFTVALLDHQASSPELVGLACGFVTFVVVGTVLFTIWGYAVYEFSRNWREPAPAVRIIHQEAPANLDPSFKAIPHFAIEVGTSTLYPDFPITLDQLNALVEGLALDPSLSFRRWVGYGKPFRIKEFRKFLDVAILKGYVQEVGNTQTLTDLGIKVFQALKDAPLPSYKK